MHEHLRQGDDGRNHSKFAAINTFKERANNRKVCRVLFDEVNERGGVEADNAPAQGL